MNRGLFYSTGFLFVAVTTAFAAEADYAKLVDALKLVSNGAYGSGCSISTKEVNGGTRVGVQNGNKSLYVTIENDNLTKLKVQDSEDGSFDYSYEVGSGSVLEITHADDAYDRTQITQNGETVSCENDY